MELPLHPPFEIMSVQKLVARLHNGKFSRLRFFKMAIILYQLRRIKRSKSGELYSSSCRYQHNLHIDCVDCIPKRVSLRIPALEFRLEMLRKTEAELENGNQTL